MSWAVRTGLQWAQDTLRQEGVNEARLAGEVLLAHALGLDRFKLYLQPQRPLDEAEAARFRELVARRGQGVPLQHLIGQVSFMGHPIQVNGRVLIPRFETEELVERALQRVSPEAPLRFLDAGTGSGAIAVALAKALPLAQGVALDRSPEALDVARANAALNRVAERLRFVEGDWLEGLDGLFELIVANPPYVPSGQIAALAREVRDHDPRLALDGGPDGLDALRRLIPQAAPRLAPGGWLLLEIGHDQADAVRALLGEVGFGRVAVYADLAGADRIAEAQWGG